MDTPKYDHPNGLVQSACKSGAMVSTLLIPGDTAIVTMFDFCALEFATGIVLLLTSVLGIWAAGRASKTR